MHCLLLHCHGLLLHGMLLHGHLLHHLLLHGLLSRNGVGCVPYACGIFVVDNGDSYSKGGRLKREKMLLDNFKGSCPASAGRTPATQPTPLLLAEVFPGSGLANHHNLSCCKSFLLTDLHDDMKLLGSVSVI